MCNPVGELKSIAVSLLTLLMLIPGPWKSLEVFEFLHARAHSYSTY